jgi:hypothetical protein
MIKVSTGLRNHMLATGSLRSALDGGEIRIYGGTIPATANDSIGSATLLCTITVASGATGLSFDVTPDDGSLLKNTDTWSGLVSASGDATFYRHVLTTDDGSSSTTELRIQGECGTMTQAKDMHMSSVTLTSGATQTLDFYSISLPSAQ